MEIVVENPGTSRECLIEMFELSDYRLKRALRQIERDMPDCALVNDSEHGVWAVETSADKCSAFEWMGNENGGFRQCLSLPEFADGRCYDHSQCESAEMTAFKRKLAYLAGPADPAAYTLGQLAAIVLERALEQLTVINPVTRVEQSEKQRLLSIVKAALAFVRYKASLRRRNTQQQWIPPDFAERLRRSSGNSFEFTLRKFFIVLDIPPESDREAVLKAWRKLARRYHPDTGNGDEERMKELNLAKARIFRIRGWD